MNLSRIAEGIVVTHWWTWLFCLGILFLYEIQAKKAHAEKLRLEAKASELIRQVSVLEHALENRQLEIDSFSDPRYGELALREELGMKRRRQIKVVFRD